MGLGSAEIISLAGARQAAREFRQQLIAGDDPIALRNAKHAARRAEAAKQKTFAECADAYVDAHRQRVAEHQACAAMAIVPGDGRLPHIGKLTVDAIDLPHILNVLEPIWNEKHETCHPPPRSHRAHLGLGHGGRNIAKATTPHDGNAHLCELLPKNGKKAQNSITRRLALDELPGFVSELRAKTGTVARALEFTFDGSPYW